MLPRQYAIYPRGLNLPTLVRFAPSGGKINPRGYIAYRLGSHGLTILLPRCSRILLLRLVYEALGAVELPQKLAEVNDSALLKYGGIILRSIFDDAILLLRSCYVTSLPERYTYCPWYTGYNHCAAPLMLLSPGLQM